VQTATQDLQTSTASPDTTGCTGGAGYCNIKNVGGGKCITDEGGTTNGTKLKLANCSFPDENQEWASNVVYVNGLETLYLSPANAPSMCMNDPNGSLSDNVQQQLWNCYSTPNEEYEAHAHSNGSSLTVTGNSDTCLTDDGNGSDNAPLLTWTCDGGGSNQLFNGNSI
jgi:hypothetical protein